MSANSHIAPTVPISYVRLLLDVATDYGVDRKCLLQGLNIPESLLQQPHGRIKLLEEYAALCRRALHMTGEPALAYEFGIRSNPATHGILGYGLMSQATFRDVLTFAGRFGHVLRMPAWNFHFSLESTHAVMEGREAISHGDLRRFSCEQLLFSVWSITRHLLPKARNIELLFDYPEPIYHKRYRRRLPQCTFSTAVTQIRVPIEYLDMPLKNADAVSAQIAEQECERELSLLGHNRDIVNQLRALLINTDEGYPSLEAVASRMFISSRTLTRQLNERGTSYRQLLAEAQKRDSRALLGDSRFTLTDIAYRLGYSSLANFARAFRSWNDLSPGEFRSRTQQ